MIVDAVVTTDRRIDDMSDLLHNLLGRTLGGGGCLMLHLLGRVRGLAADIFHGDVGDVDLVCAAVADEGRQILGSAWTAVIDGCVLFASSVELDGRESGNLLRHIVGRGVDLGNSNKIAMRAEQTTEVFIFGSKTGR